MRRKVTVTDATALRPGDILDYWDTETVILRGPYTSKDRFGREMTTYDGRILTGDNAGKEGPMQFGPGGVARVLRSSEEYQPNEDQTWRELYAREYRKAEAHGLESWRAREEAARIAWEDYEARTGRRAFERNASNHDAWNEEMRSALAVIGRNRTFTSRDLLEQVHGTLSSTEVRWQLSRLARAGYLERDESGAGYDITKLGWDWIEGADRRYSVNGSSYYVWELAVGSDAPLGQPLGPYGTLESAKTFARIGATEGKHDRAVTSGVDPKAASFKIVRRYRAGTGERLV